MFIPQYSEGSYVGNMEVPDDQGSAMTYAKFMALSPQERHDYLIQGDVTPYGHPLEYGYAANLRNVVPDDAHANATLSADQYRTILSSSGIDPTMAQGIASNLGVIIDDQNRAAQDSTMDKIAKAGAFGIAGLAGGLGFAGALGAGAGAAGGATGSLGSGLTAGAGGITGLTPGLTTGGIGGGALGGGIGTGAASAAGLTAGSIGALGAGAFGAESLYPAAAGSASGSASGGATGLGAGGAGAAAGGLSGALSNPALLGGALGLAAGGLGGGNSPAGTTTTVQDIPDWLKPYATGMLNQATDAFNSMSKTSPVMPAAQDEYLKTIQGAYLDPSTNPWLSQTYDMGAGKLKASMSPTFGHMQAFGQNSGYQQAMGRTLGDFATNLYGGNYQQERNRQATATNNAPNFTTGGYEAAFAPFSQYKNLLGGFGQQTTSPYFNNQMGNAIGGGLLGAGLGRMFA